MSDNLFDRLADLLSSTGPVNWKLARELAGSVAGPSTEVSRSTVGEFEELTTAAQLQLSTVSDFDVNLDVLAVRVVDRRTWAQANSRAFGYLVEPLAAQADGATGDEPLAALTAGIYPAILGMQLGSMVGFMSHRVLGQFDTGIPAIGPPEIYFVSPNIDEFASDSSLDLRQVRLWAALHEVIRHAQMALPGVANRFVTLVETYVADLELNPEALASRFEGLQDIEDPATLASWLEDPAGIAELLVSPEQQANLEEIQVFMAFLEGYAEHLLDRLAPQLLPELPRLREALDRRRATPAQGQQLLQRMLGLELKRQQYRKGARFCEDVAERWGEKALATAWSDAALLPVAGELDDPVTWAARALLPTDL